LFQTPHQPRNGSSRIHNGPDPQSMSKADEYNMDQWANKHGANAGSKAAAAAARGTQDAVTILKYLAADPSHIYMPTCVGRGAPPAYVISPAIIARDTHARTTMHARMTMPAPVSMPAPVHPPPPMPAPRPHLRLCPPLRPRHRILPGTDFQLLLVGRRRSKV